MTTLRDYFNDFAKDLIEQDLKLGTEDYEDLLDDYIAGIKERIIG
jgi:hypothetical protein